MTNLIVDISSVADGNMLNRHDPLDGEVIAARERYLQAHSITMDQCTRLRVNALQRDKVEHDTNWCRYFVVDAKDKGAGMRDDNAVIADALVTTEMNHALLLPVADCIGTVIFDPTKNVLMMTHLGRQSLEQHGAVRSVVFLTDTYGCNPKDLKVWMTPAVGKDVYPLWSMDHKSMKEVMFEQLREAGVRDENVTDHPAETDSDPNYYSYTNLVNGRTDVDGDHAIIAMMVE